MTQVAKLVLKEMLQTKLQGQRTKIVIHQGFQLGVSSRDTGDGGVMISHPQQCQHLVAVATR